MHYAIIGAGFGNEGKAQTVHDLIGSSYNPSITFKVGGTSFPGHTSIGEARRGSGKITFSAGHYGGNVLRDSAITVLPEQFYLNPMMFRDEHSTNNYRPSKHNEFHAYCRVITPWDILLERQVCRMEGRKLDEEICTGYHEAKLRSSNPDFELQIREKTSYSDCNLTIKLFDIMNVYIPHRLKELGIKRMDDDLHAIWSNTGCLYRFITDIDYFTKKFGSSKVVKQISSEYSKVFYEGSRGILEDPHEGLRAAVDLWATYTNKSSPLEVIYVTRCYTTKLGDGELPFELDSPPYDIDPTLGQPYEKNLRYSYLNLDLIKEAIQKDMAPAADYDRINFSGLMTCKDHLGGHEIKYIEDNEVKTVASFDELKQKYSDIIGGPVAYRGTLDENPTHYFLDEWIDTDAESDYW